ncbi:MAG: tetratricopeptide repeat protein [Deltaproteobacteria bacterium]|nr:MAG: tetratricopeptide repeat protein [Deltaproteobacteria bacterium]
MSSLLLNRRMELPAQVALLLLAAILPYLNTLDVPWYFDDTNNIVDNPLIRDLPRAARDIFVSRGIAMLTFALNFRFGGLDTTGYHIVNLGIHAACVLVVWLLLRRLLDRTAQRWALPGALLFAVHPVQTQAVTYVVQRMTSLAALCFFSAVLCYLLSLDDADRRRAWYGLALLGGALAVLTKEQTAVLPLVLLAVERCFRPGRGWRRQLLSLLPFCAVPAWKAVEMLLLPVWRGDVAATVRYADQLQSMQNVTPLRYLFTEFSVLWHYLKLLVLPVGQRLDYGWPVVDTLLTLPNIAALLGLLIIGGVAWRVRHARPLAAFGVAWFFLALAVESSLIPLDPIFEHRLYLPMFGMVLVLLDLLQRMPSPKMAMTVVLLVVSLLAGLTWQRNALWGDPVAFFEDNLRRSPNNVRVMVMLGNAYAAARRSEEGLRLIEEALRLNPSYDFAYTALGKIRIDRGEGALAIEPLQKGLEYQPGSVLLNEYLGIAYGEAGDYQRALLHLRRAMLLNPEDASVYTNIGVAFSAIGDNRQAAGYFERSLALAPDSEKAWYNYAATLYNLGERQKALDALRAVVAINPDNADAYYGFGTLALEFGRRDEAAAARDALRRLGDERAAELAALLDR